MTEAQEKAPGLPRASTVPTAKPELGTKYSPFATSAMDYLDAGFQPIRARKDKSPADTGVTGWNGEPDDPATLGHRAASGGRYNIGLRLDGDLIGLDVDQYGDKTGAETWQEAIDAHGEPPATWISTSRDLPSGIRLYRWPHPIENDERKPAGSLPGIETLHRGHRHMMVTPSVHPEGRRYRWIRPDGAEAEPGEYPQAENIPRLPDAWVEHFRKACECFEAPLNLRQLVMEGDGTEAPVRKVLDEFHKNFAGGRHDATTRAIAGLYVLEQWPGATDARQEVERTFLNSVTSDRSRSEREARAELHRMSDRLASKYEQRPFEDRTPRTRPKGSTVPPVGSTLRELLGKHLAPPRWAIADLIPEGLTVLAGKPKIGKSWMTLDLCLSIAEGGDALDHFPCEVGEVLIIAYEDSERRLQDRFRAYGADQLPPEALNRIHVRTDWPTIDREGLDRLDEWLTDHPACRLFLIDTYQRFRGGSNMNARHQYAEDYDTSSRVQNIAKKHRVAGVLVHHVRQMPAEDWMDTVAGSSGITGAADTTMAIFGERGQHDATLKGTGRDIEDFEHALEDVGDGFKRWRYMGDAELYRLSRERTEVLEAIASLNATVSDPVKVSEIAAEVGKTTANVSKMLRALFDDKKVVRPKRGHYALASSSYISVDSVDSVESESTQSTQSTHLHNQTLTEEAS